MTTDDETADPTASAQIDAYLAAIPEDMAGALQALRQTIQAAAPQASEAISYQVPAFRYHGRPLVSFGAAKNHCSFYVMGTAVMDAHREELEPYDTSKGTIRFTPESPLPDALVRTLVRARMAQTDAGSKKA